MTGNLMLRPARRDEDVQPFLLAKVVGVDSSVPSAGMDEVAASDIDPGVPDQAPFGVPEIEPVAGPQRLEARDRSPNGSLLGGRARKILTDRAFESLLNEA